jgi:hypothetical protein
MRGLDNQAEMRQNSCSRRVPRGREIRESKNRFEKLRRGERRKKRSARNKTKERVHFQCM